ncbi:MAG: hypothetical protein MUD12_01290 [Spirochaetes bacterium]|nr:hypothetical protein [Spirochaetota bacterium]
MKKNFLILTILALPIMIFSQESTDKKAGSDAPKKIESQISTSIPVQAQYSDEFAIKNIEFSRKVDLLGKGDILEVKMMFDNLNDDPKDLYIFVIASYEKIEKTKSSFERPVPEKERIRTFVPFPNNIENFKYPDKDKQGNIKKDYQGRDKFKYIKFPKDPKAGIDPATQKPYRLTDKLLVVSEHLSKYRKNFFYFNEVAILVFDKDGKPVFRQLYKLKGYRR